MTTNRRSRMGFESRAALALALFLLPFSALARQAEAPAAPSAAYQEIDALAAAELAKDNVAGVTVGVVSGGGLAWTKSYGFADSENKIQAAKDTVYRIGSITKQFTALMLLQLVQDGKVHFSDPVEKYFPDVNKVTDRFPGAPPITLMQLATHTSGLGREPSDLDTYLKGPVSDWEKVLIAALPHTKYEFEPGTRFSYSNIGYAILGAALGRAAGQPYVDYVRDRIFKPLGMTSSAFEPNDAIKARISKGYQEEKDKVDTETPQREHLGRGYKVPNGAIYTTGEDLAKFVIFEMGGGPASVLSKEKLEEHYKRIISADANLRSAYGAGFEVFRRGDLIGVGHSGAVAGYQAAAYFDRTSKTGVIVLRNAIGPFSAARLAVAILIKMTARDVAAQWPPSPKADSGAGKDSGAVKNDASTYAAYTGQYELPGLGILTITSEGSKLFGQPGEGPREELIPQSENQFSVPRAEAQVSFVKDSSGNVTSLVVKHGNQEIQGKKIK
jgi:CubicO group peptidase (beta-lactamase class C family)